MEDCQPVYLMAWQDETLVGRAALWVIRDEALPIGPGAGRAIFKAILRRWPLLVCRSPLSNSSGLVLPPEPSRGNVLRALTQSALDISRQKHCSFLVFDFLDEESIYGWPDAFSSVAVDNPGTILKNRWHSMEEYLADGNKKDRQHYKRTLREAEKLGIRIERHTRVPDAAAALDLIHKVDRYYQNEPNPWTRSLLDNLEMINGVWLEARQNGKLVGCGASLEDNKAQLTTALGLEDDIPYAYLLLTYASLEEALSRQVRFLRWGSGAYEVKRQLGFEMERSNHAMVAPGNFLLNMVLKIFM